MEKKVVIPFKGFSLYSKNRLRNDRIRKAWDKEHRANSYFYVDENDQPKSIYIDKDKIKL